MLKATDRTDTVGWERTTKADRLLGSISDWVIPRIWKTLLVQPRVRHSGMGARVSFTRIFPLTPHQWYESSSWRMQAKTGAADYSWQSKGLEKASKMKPNLRLKNVQKVWNFSWIRVHFKSYKIKFICFLLDRALQPYTRMSNKLPYVDNT